MKYRIRKLFALTLALSMLLSMIPFGMAAESLDEFEGYETLEEIPFEFELEPGDLPFEQLKDAVLAAEDIPYCIDPALAEARGHVNRLYLQEPDDYTVMFQNRDGSKTVYVFSHPVKGMTMTTTASIQVNGSVISFSGTNAITSRLSELSDYNIGYSEIAYIPNGILSADGIDLTEDARGWARSESMPSALSYNISSEAAAEYAASVTVPDADVSLAAVTPGVTITPNDPAPLGGMTVMSISYSDLAGLMSFKNTVTNKYLTLDASSTTLSTSTSRLPLEYSQWAVQYHSTFEYTISSLSDPYNTYLGHNTTESVSIGPLYSATYTFSLNIVSSTNSTVNIYSDEIAIDSDGEIYELSPDESEYPNSCVWQIIDKRILRLVTSISVPTTIVEQSGVAFIYSNRYSFPQQYPTYYEMELYDATTNQPFEFDTKIYEDDEYWCTVETSGDYTVYFKDEVTRIKSPNFTLTVVDHIIIPESDVRIEQKNVGFTLDYTFYPGASTYSNVKLYYADTNTEVPHTGDTYTIPTAGVYSVYYKDSVSGVTSVEFTMIIIETSGAGQPVNFPSNHTYAIQPYGYGNLFLTMTDNDGIGTTQNSFSVKSLINEWYDQSQTFVFDTAEGDSYSRTIFATLSTVQSGAPANYRTSTVYQYTQPYYYPNVDNICNSLSYFQGSEYPEGVEKSAPESVVQIYDLGGYYIISFGLSSNNKLLALKYDTNTTSDEDNVIVAEYSPADTSFRWNITYVGIDTPLIKQTHSAGCGATATLMYMYGMGLDEIDSTDNLTALQTELRTALNFNLDTYIIVYNITNYINGMYQDLNINPQLEYCDDYTSDTEQLSKLSNNIANQNIMIARVTMLDLNYYDSSVRGTYHYVNVVGKIVINGVNNYVVMDCHYDDTYFGIHIIDEEELVGAITHLIAKQ